MATKKFSNASGLRINKGLGDLLKWQLSGQRKKWPSSVPINRNLQIFADKNKVPAGQIYVTWVNHVTFLVQTRELSFLTDPVFSRRVSPVSWAGPRRVHEVGIPLEQLPPLDFILLSHNHYDHMDLSALKKYTRSKAPPLYVPLNNAHYLTTVPQDKITELDWWQSLKFNASTEITLLPAQHWSGRGLGDRNEALWGGFGIRNDAKNIYFAGDTGWGDFLNDILRRWGRPNLSFLPIGAYEPRWFMKDQHMNPDDAVKAHVLLNAQQSIGMHFGSFQLTDEAFDEPVRALGEARKKYGISPEAFVAPQPGVTLILPWQR